MNEFLFTICVPLLHTFYCKAVIWFEEKGSLGSVLDNRSRRLLSCYFSNQIPKSRQWFYLSQANKKLVHKPLSFIVHLVKQCVILAKYVCPRNRRIKSSGSMKIIYTNLYSLDAFTCDICQCTIQCQGTRSQIGVHWLCHSSLYHHKRNARPLPGVVNHYAKKYSISA